MKNKKIAFTILAAAVMLFLSITGCRENDNAHSDPTLSESNATTPNTNVDDSENIFFDFSEVEATDQNGNTFSQENFADKDVTILNLWGTFCTPCVEEMPDLNQFAKKLPDNVQLVTLCVDASESPDDAKKILENTGFDEIALLSGNEAFQKICNEMLSLPMTLFIDRDGHMIGDGHMMDDIFDSGDEQGNTDAGVILGGGMDNFEEVYLKAVNRALRAIGREEISFTDEKSS